MGCFILWVGILVFTLVAKGLTIWHQKTCLRCHSDPTVITRRSHKTSTFHSSVCLQKITCLIFCSLTIVILTGNTGDLYHKEIHVTGMQSFEDILTGMVQIFGRLLVYVIGWQPANGGSSSYGQKECFSQLTSRN